MSGIAVVLGGDPAALERALASMLEALAHRGPGAQGREVLPAEGVALGACHPEGGPPSPHWDTSGRYATIIDGTLFNAREIEQALAAAGATLPATPSAADLVAAAFARWGSDVFPRLHGAFAIAVWDRGERRLVVARDPVGERPLYAAALPGGHAVASEMGALLRLPGVDREIDPVGLEQYLAFRFSVAPRTVVRGVQKIPAAHFAIVDRQHLAMEPYRHYRFQPRPWRWRALLADLDATLDRATRHRMAPSGPTGLLLSGGLDSTAVAYYMRRHAAEVAAFTIGFDVPGRDETTYARLAARHLGLRHHVEVVAERQVPDIITAFADAIDEPIGGGSALAMYVLGRVTRSEAAVVLGGDGGDGQFLGNERLVPLSLVMATLPRWLRAAGTGIAPLVPRRGLLGRARALLAAPGESPIHRMLAHYGSVPGGPRAILAPEIRAALPASAFADVDRRLADLDRRPAVEQWIAGYLRTFIPENSLFRLDRISMASSLETGSPFLDTEVIDLLATVPARMKFGARGKAPVRRLMRGRIPEAIIERRKFAFRPPMDAWLRGRLRPVLLDVLSPARIEAGGLFMPAAVSRLVDEHLASVANHSTALRLLLMFELWRTRWLAAIPASP